MSLILSGCGIEEDISVSTYDNGILDIYTTLYPLEYFTSEICGEHVNVDPIFLAGADPHILSKGLVQDIHEVNEKSVKQLQDMIVEYVEKVLDEVEFGD
ncbi:hypothetical protein ACFQ3N_14515 [Virgibacillus byunsanensis]|uniref:DUF4825 domain-containing protein n=1 Tax=Virgibacillus byunsanensis TaxID=570945 RepID=A0ABW3LQK3_9BACI